jgi:hypothetical protein
MSCSPRAGDITISFKLAAVLEVHREHPSKCFGSLFLPLPTERKSNKFEYSKNTKNASWRQSRDLILQVNLSLCLISQALCHEDICGEWRYNSTTADLGTSWR